MVTFQQDLRHTRSPDTQGSWGEGEGLPKGHKETSGAGHGDVGGRWGGGYRGKEFRIQENEDPGDLDMHLVLLLTSYMRMVVKSFNIFKSQFPHLRKGPKTFWH